MHNSLCPQNGSLKLAHVGQFAPWQTANLLPNVFGSHLPGIAPELLSMVAKSFNCSLQAVAFDKVGELEIGKADGNFGGFLDQMVNGEVDVSTTLTLTSDRSRKLKSSQGIGQWHYRFFRKAQNTIVYRNLNLAVYRLVLTFLGNTAWLSSVKRLDPVPWSIDGAPIEDFLRIPSRIVGIGTSPSHVQ